MKFKYANCKCDHCQNAFTEQDDIVVCPVCGAPQHRSCYFENNACAHESEHAAGYEWKAPAAEKTENEQGHTKQCLRCGAMNVIEADSCQLCGAAFSGDDDDGYGCEQSAPDFEIDGVTSQEMEAYLGNSAYAFMPKFELMQRSQMALASWNLPALFFGPFYFFYRRINKIGLILLLALVVIYVPGVVYTLEYFKSALAPEMFGLTLEYNQRILDVFGPISTIASYLRIGLHVYCSAKANKYFLGRMISDIRDMQTRYPENERGEGYLEALGYRGRPAFAAALFVAFAVFAVLYIVIYLGMLPMFAQ